MTVTIHTGDVFDCLAKLPDESVHCVVTSPPYWGLRDYGVEGQIGLEPTLAEHLDVMVQVFNQVWRVLRNDGTLWLNYGDCYATAPNGRSAADTKAVGADERTFRDKPFSTVQGTLKPKDLCMVPNRLAIALQDAGWWVRSEIIWAKPNPMPESAKDRPSSSHEKVWLLTKGDRYFYDHEAVKEPTTKTGSPGHLQSGKNSREKVRRTPVNGWANSPNYKGQLPGEPKRPAGEKKTEQRPSFRGGCYVNNTPGKSSDTGNVLVQNTGRNLRNVWTIATSAFPEAHFATFPPELAETCIRAGCPEGGTVLDPFGGAGTTGLVADRLQRNAILIELNPEYVEIASRRIDGDAGMFSPLQAAE